MIWLGLMVIALGVFFVNGLRKKYININNIVKVFQLYGTNIIQNQFTMSVINNSIPESNSNTFTNQRIAFAGCMGSGKTFAAKKTLQKFGSGKILSLSSAIKKMVFGNNMFDNRDGYQTVGTIGRRIDPEAWVRFISHHIQEVPPNTMVNSFVYFFSRKGDPKRQHYI